MKIILSCKNLNSPSYIFYKESLKKLNKKNNSIKIFFKKFSPKILDENFDIFLFMSGTNIGNLKKKDKSKYGIIDPRAANYDNFRNYDFIIANGLEEKLFFSHTNLPIFIYPVYPSVRNKKKINKKKTIISYHGNKEHLLNMLPRITNAIKKISNEYNIELKLIYDIMNKGSVKELDRKHLNCKVTHLQYYENCFDKYLINTDIGIVTQLNNFENKKIKKNIGYFLSKQLFKGQYSFSLNFKETTNLGRHFVFAQLKIPVISDYTISSSNFINHMKNGILAYNSNDWYESIKYLIENKSKSKSIGIQFYKDWKKNFSHKVLNKRLLDFFKNKNVK